MKYIEFKIEIIKDMLELAEKQLEAAGFDSLMIDDPADVQDILDHPKEYRYDYINEELTAAENLNRKPVITLYFTDDEDGAYELESAMSVAADLAMQLDIKGAGKNDITVQTQAVDDQDWLYKWQEYFKPAKVTDRLVVKPSWEQYEAAVDPATGLPELVIEIDPGMAFGTGTHETTSMCMKALEKAIAGKYDSTQTTGSTDEQQAQAQTNEQARNQTSEQTRELIGELAQAQTNEQARGYTVLDVGCGSGILAIAAALLGAEEALGIEIDTDAVEVAKQNVELNGLTDKIKIQYGDLTQGVDYQADIVVANLMADLVIMLTRDVAKHLKPNGIYISSGILNEKEAIVSEAITAAGFTIIEVLHDGEWCAIVAQLA